MNDARSDARKICEALEKSAEIHKRLVAIGEERKLNREEAHAILSQVRTKSTRKHDAWTIALIILIIIEIVWLLGMIWGML